MNIFAVNDDPRMAALELLTNLYQNDCGLAQMLSTAISKVDI